MGGTNGAAARPGDRDHQAFPALTEEQEGGSRKPLRFIGADPDTAWIGGCQVEPDRAGSVGTGDAARDGAGDGVNDAS